MRFCDRDFVVISQAAEPRNDVGKYIVTLREFAVDIPFGLAQSRKHVLNSQFTRSRVSC